jgi:hypothetical protein
MKDQQSATISWVLFWTFWLIYVFTALGTLGMLFFGFGTVQGSERTILVNAFLVETAIAILGLFYSVFKLKRPIEEKAVVKQNEQPEVSAKTLEQGMKEPPFDPGRHRSQIEKAVYEMRNITRFDLCWTGIGNDNDFLEFCLQDFSETWLVQEISDPTLTVEIRRQIRIVNRHLNDRESRHKDVLIILLVYRNLSYEEKASLFNQLQLFKSSESLSPKIRFNVWDQADVEKALKD